jgi:hypothetical protein
MIVRQTMMVVAAVGVLSVGVAAPVTQQRAHGAAMPPMQWLHSCNSATPHADCTLVLASASNDDDWTAAGGAMRGLDK